MALEQRIDLRLTQKLALTPQLQLQLKLLQLPQLELLQYLQLELTENPLLELEEDIEASVDIGQTKDEVEPLLLSRIDKIIIDEYFAQRADDGRDLGYFNPGIESRPSFELFYSSSSDLSEHLLWQLRLSRAEHKVREVAEVVIGNIDEDGYLRASEEELAKLSGADIETVKKAISLVQNFDPPGVCARDLRECLLLQLKSLELENTIVKSLVEEHLEDIYKKRYDRIAKRFGISIDEVLEAIKIIEKLEPRPGRNYTNSVPAIPVPDVYVKKVDDEYQIFLNDDGLPRIRLNNYYYELLKSRKVSSDEKKFIQEKFKNAIYLIKSLEQRNRTIYRVTESLLKFQREFFEKGVSYLKPLNLRAISEDLGLHESTISRVTSNKYLACDHGLFSFKFFFSHGIQSSQGTISTTKVKELIQKLIEEENPDNPLSDSEISEMLKKQGIDIARRTVAKYREELKIPPKSQRRQKITKGGQR